MPNPLLLGLKSVTLPGMGVGVLATVVATKYARPLAVSTLRLGFQIKDGSERIWQDARAAASGMAHDAKAAASDLADEARKPATSGKGK